MMGASRFDLGEPQRALEHNEQALAIARELCHREGERCALGRCGSCYRTLGEYQSALAKALVSARELGHRVGAGS
jgi:hypothetical protein